MIPEVAVEAAAIALKSRCGKWDSWTALAQTALEAAAPHMLAEAWDEGHIAGDGDQSTMWDARNAGKPVKYADIATPNPYRPTP